ncbi:CPBP family intramembrane glutamic endopeptidase [Rufibacter hautae]|uniref:CPBP family intramembrane metalloprotease n=1 Tax=Rufibacter hautae TaxID=2595005 RepID=A0A5B6TKM7_9BACT|nr:CPBP family intramembrane glutamic endopeptidase [Rufibacter hautae]KAA3440020.1 CPBP family intramembrane metalloprotease [Rufibacter hautae]
MYLIPTPDFLSGAFEPSENNITWLSLLTAALIAPVLKEIIFRGVILKGLLCQYNPAKAIVVSSLIFGFVHLNPWQFLGAFGIGIISGWIYWRTNNLLLPIVMHISNNLFFSLFGKYFGTSYLIDTPMQQVFGNQLNQSIAVGLSILLFAVIWYILSRRMRYQELRNTSHNIA